MINIELLKEENKRWHEKHIKWMKEVEYWQSETERLVALLYQLDRALPEHSALLAKHISLIEQHEQMMKCLECEDMDKHCMPTCLDFNAFDQQSKFHQKMVDLHHEVEQQHMALNKTYLVEMEKFSALAKKLVNEIEAS